MENLTIRLSKADRAKLDKLRGSQTPSACIRSLIRKGARSGKTPTRADALNLLREQAEAGKVAAAVKLEELTRQDAELERLRPLTTDAARSCK
jgi:hypothetical protein